MTEKTFPAKDTALNDVLSFAEEELMFHIKGRVSDSRL